MKIEEEDKKDIGSNIDEDDLSKINISVQDNKTKPPVTQRGISIVLYGS